MEQKDRELWRQRERDKGNGDGDLKKIIYHINSTKTKT